MVLQAGMPVWYAGFERIIAGLGAGGLEKD